VMKKEDTQSYITATHISNVRKIMWMISRLALGGRVNYTRGQNV